MYGLRCCLRLAFALALLALAETPAVQAAPIDDAYADAANHYKQQRYEAAIAGFRKLLAEHGAHPNAQFFLAESLLQTGKNEEAAEVFEQFALAHPQDRFAAQATFRVGEAAYLRGDFAAALPKLQAFVAAHSDNKLTEYALPYLADCQLEQADLKGAQASYQQALKRHPQGALAGECRLGLARLAELHQNDGEARRFYEFLVMRGNSPAAVEAQLRLGQLLYRQNDYAGAAEHLQPLAEATVASATRTSARYWLGFVLLEQNEHDRAHALWTTAVREDAAHPLAPAIALALAESYGSTEKAEDAVAWCQRIARDWPRSAYADDAAAHEIQLALVAGRPDDVGPLAANFARLHPDSPLRTAVSATLGRAHLARGEFRDAIAVLEPLAKEHSPDRSRLQHSLALAQLGAKQWEQALATLNGLDTKDASADVQAGILAARGSALLALGRGDEAVEPLRKYLKDHRRGADAAKCGIQLCVALVQAKQFVDAQKAWDACVKQNADEPTLLPTTLYLAEAAAEAGEREQAQAWFEYLASDQRPAEIRERAIAGLAWLAEKEGGSIADARLAQLEKQSPQTSQAAAIALRRAQNLETQGHRENALATYLALVKEHPQASQAPDAMFAAARLHDALTQDREAFALLERLLKEHAEYPHRDAATYQMAWVLVDLNRHDDAAKQFAQLNKQHRESQYWADATYRLAKHYVQTKRHADAGPLLERLLASKPTEELVASGLLLQGQSAAAQQKWTDVAPPLLQLIERFPQHAERPLAEYWLAEADYRSGRLREAGDRLASLSLTLEKRTDAWIPLVPLRRAQVLAHQQQWQEAYEIAVTIAEKHPSFRQQHEVDYLLGRCLGALAKFDDARAAYERVVKSPIGGGTETAAMAQWMIGESYFQQERYDDAITAYHRVERLFAFERWQAAALLQAGKCHEAKGTYRDAIGLYAQLLKQYPKTTFAQEASQRMRVAQQRATDSTKRQE